MAYRDTARQFITCTVMSGRNALFWLDDWTGMGSLLHLTGPTGPQVSGISITASVFQALSEGRWTTSRNRHPTLSLLRSCMPSPLPSLDSEEPDFFLWRNSPHDPPDIFSASKVWNFLKPIETLVPLFSLVWFKQKIPKHAFIAWLTFRDHLATRDRLSTWGIQVSPDCMLCGDENETKNHLFFDCCFSREVWNSFFDQSSLNPPNTFEGVEAWLRSSAVSKELKPLVLLIFQATIYFLWKERNSRLHTSSSKPSQVVIKEIQLQIRARLLGLDRERWSTTHSVTTAASTHIRTTTYLSLWFENFQLH